MLGALLTVFGLAAGVVLALRPRLAVRVLLILGMSILGPIAYFTGFGAVKWLLIGMTLPLILRLFIWLLYSEREKVRRPPLYLWLMLCLVAHVVILLGVYGVNKASVAALKDLAPYWVIPWIFYYIVRSSEDVR